MTIRRWITLVAVAALVLALMATGEFCYYPGECVLYRWEHFQMGFARMGKSALDLVLPGEVVMDEILLKIIQVLTCQLASSVLLRQTIENTQVDDLVRHPRPGDLVVENSARTLDGIGRLIVVRDEFVKFEDEEGGYTDKFWYLETLDGELKRWRNCDFYRVLERSWWDIKRNGDTDRSEWVALALKRHDLS